MLLLKILVGQSMVLDLSLLLRVCCKSAPAEGLSSLIESNEIRSCCNSMDGFLPQL